MNTTIPSPDVQQELEALEAKFGQATSLLEVTLFLDRVTKLLPNDYDLGNYIRKYVNQNK